MLDVQLCTLFCGVWEETRKKIDRASRERDGERLLVFGPVRSSCIQARAILFAS